MVLALVGSLLEIIGTALIFDHAWRYEKVFDREDFLGHDWLGFIAILFGFFLSVW